ncbi:hypothetical protein OG568_60100 (plasmid) [Streptomyces sp. NBC_01450]|uniref:hypothetical protein n=1 Tax=Streptomyces sp. NBC_01450 TaxID=2903871 RepID=UPI002E34EF47|nr:hypothetical protein [Streptomyces sp. NBC_01450]
MVFDNEVERTISDDIRVITATEIPGTSFTGQAIPPRKGKIRTERHLAGLVESRFADVVNGLYSDRLHLVERRNDGKSNSFSMSDRYDKALTVRLDVIPLPAGIVARTYVNTTSDNHTIQLPDTIDAQQVDRALSHELGELLAVRERARINEETPFQDSLKRGPVRGPVALSDEDLGRVSELNYLASRMNDRTLAVRERSEARKEFSFLLDHTGLRSQAFARESEARTEEQYAADLRITSIRRHLSPTALRELQQLSVPIHQLGGFDAHALLDFRARVRSQPAQNVTGTGIGNHPVPGFRADGSAISRAELSAEAQLMADTRTGISQRTLDELRSETRQTGQSPSRKVIIGGGASLAGRDPEALLIDARGRWHLDPGEGIFQSADQVRDTRAIGLGYSHQFTDPTSRVTMQAVQLWEDTLASRGPLVDGSARLVAGEDGNLWAHIVPNDGSESVRVRVEGVPTVATGIPPQLIPGADLAVPTIAAVHDRLHKTLPDDSPAHEQLTAVATARETLEVLQQENSENALRADPSAGAAMRTLDATVKWDDARETLPGKVLLGDAVSDNKFDPHIANSWLISGASGNAISAAEIILEANPNAKVAIVGSNIPPILFEQIPLRVARERYEAAYGGDGRLSFHIAPGNRARDIPITYNSEGEARFRVGDVEAEAYIASLARTAPVPEAVQGLNRWIHTSNGNLEGDLMFDKNSQYLGYSLTFQGKGSEHQVHVTGAASGFLPNTAFSPQVQNALNDMGARQVPLQSGSPAVGFAPTAWQSILLAKARQKGEVELHKEPPSSWIRTEPASVASNYSIAAASNLRPAPATRNQSRLDTRFPSKAATNSTNPATRARR